MIYRMLAGVGFFALAGCTTTLDTTQLKNQTEIKKQTSDLIYALPLRQFDITVVRQLTKCGDEAGGDSQISVSTELTIDPGFSEDAAYTFRIDPRSLSEWLNSSEFKVDYHPGTRFLKTVNASVKDEAGPAAVSVIKGIAGLIGISSGVGAAPVSPTSACTNTAHTALAKYYAAKTALEVATTDLQEKTQKLALLSSVVDELATLGNADAAISAAQAAAKDVRDSEETLEGARKTFNRAKSAVQIVDRVTWPKSTLGSASQIISSMDENQIKKWLKKPPTDSYEYADAAQLFDVGAEIRDGFDSKTAALFSTSEELSGQIFYRQPRAGVLVLKTVTTSQRNSWIQCIANDGKDKDGNDVDCQTLIVPAGVAKTHNDTFPQLGTVNGIEVKVRTFENVSFSASFGENGALLSTGYKELGTPAVTAASLFEQGVAQAVAFETAREGQAAKDQAAEVMRLQNLVKIEEANAKLHPEAPTELETLQAEIALLKARAERDALLSD